MGKDYFEVAGRQFPAVTWYKDRGLTRTYLCLMLVVLTAATNGYDGSMMNGLQTLPPWQNKFNHPNGSTLGILNAIMSIGSICAIPVVPYCVDILGRRAGILIGCLIMVLGVILQSIAVNIGMFIAARFFIGFGVAIAHGGSPLLITELAHPQHRAKFTTIYNTLWYGGSIIAAWLTYGTAHMTNNWAWRIPTIVQLAPSVIQICAIYFVPESPRYLLNKGKDEQALHILAKVHANGNMDDEMVQCEFVEIRDTLKLEREVESNGWSELIRTKGNRHRLLIMITAGFFSQWSGNGLVSYYLNKVLNDIGYTDTLTQNLINGCLQIFNLITAVGACFFIDKVGRRKLFLASTAGMLVTFIAWTICSARYAMNGDKGAANAVIAMIFLYYLCYNSAWSGLLLGYTTEILPYNIRAKGLTIMFLCVDLALFFNQYVNPIALEALAWKYYIFYCCWLAIELVVVYFFYIETRNTPLEEIAKHFDGENAVVAGGAASNKGAALAMEMGLEGTVQQIEEKRGSVHVDRADSKSG